MCKMIWKYSAKHTEITTKQTKCRLDSCCDGLSCTVEVVFHTLQEWMTVNGFLWRAENEPWYLHKCWNCADSSRQMSDSCFYIALDKNRLLCCLCLSLLSQILHTKSLQLLITADLVCQSGFSVWEKNMLPSSAPFTLNAEAINIICRGIQVFLHENNSGPFNCCM